MQECAWLNIFIYFTLFKNRTIYKMALQVKKEKKPSDKDFLIYLRWLDWIFWGWYLPTLSINYVCMSKDMEKRLPQLY